MKTQVTLAYDYTDSEGKQHKAGQTPTLDFFEARKIAAAGLGQIKTKPATEAADAKAGK